MPSVLDSVDGQRAFGRDPANYDEARPDYPDRVFELLRVRCGLGPGIDAFEIGPGTGVATRPLLEAGAAVVVVEADERLARHLEAHTPGDLTVLVSPFEQAELPEGEFDLGCSATAFHWLDQRPALAKVARVLRPGGWWAMWWNVFGDPDRRDAFHEATKDLLSSLPTSPSQPMNWRHPFALDSEVRIADLESVGAFEEIGLEILRWTLVLDPAQVRGLYATFSQFSVLSEDDRNRLLDALSEIASHEFAGCVERNMCTPIYTVRRR